MRLDGARVVLTGASSGIGAAVAAVLARRGARLVLAARNLPQLEAVAAAAGGRADRLRVMACDVTRPAAVHDLCEEARSWLGGVDVLINNAGVCLYGDTIRATPGDVAAVMAVNFYGALYTMNQLLPTMVRQGRGTVVTVASLAGLYGVPYLGAYSASKAALVALTQALRAELHDTGVRFLNFYPGYTRTPLFLHEKQLGGARRPRTGYASADLVARSLVRALEDDRDEVVLTPPGRILAAVRGAFPGVVDRAMRRIAVALRAKDVNHA